MVEQSIKPARSRKVRRSHKPWKEGRPPRPYADFPLSPHAIGTWCKKIQGKIHHFGRWAKRVNAKLQRVPGDGWEDALKLYRLQVESIVTGRPKPQPTELLTLADLCNRFYTAKRRKSDSEEMTARTSPTNSNTTLSLNHWSESRGPLYLAKSAWILSENGARSVRRQK